MFFSGMLHVLLPAGFIERRFKGMTGVIQAVLFGVPLPLCSCSVVPTGIGLKNEGASDGAAIGFLISTPQTGVDSILVSASFFGWPFAIFKMVAATATGVAGGWLAEFLATEEQGESQSKCPKCCQHQGPVGAWWQRFWTHGVEVIRSIWVWLVIGIVLSGVLEILVPGSWYEMVNGWGLLPAMGIMLLVSTPLYVCATASVPIAASLVAGGFPPGAAMVFLMAGPATNVATISAIFGRFGWKTGMLYLVVIILGSILAGLGFDSLLAVSLGEGAAHGHHEHRTWIHIVSAFLLATMLMTFAIQDLQKRLQS